MALAAGCRRLLALEPTGIMAAESGIAAGASFKRMNHAGPKRGGGGALSPPRLDGYEEDRPSARACAKADSGSPVGRNSWPMKPV